MNRTANILRLTASIDKIGGEMRKWVTVKADLPCRIAPLSGRERAMFGTTGVSVTHRMYCSPADITEVDEIESSGTRYQVVYVGGDSAGHHMQIDLLELRHGS
jgi:head-tail adaptor